MKTDKRDTDSSDKPKTKAKMKIGNKNKKKGKKKKNFANDEAEHQVKKLKTESMTNFFLKMGYPRPLFCLFLVKHQCNFYNIIFIQYPVLGLNPEPLDQGSYPIDKYIFAAIALNTE